jgi:hypothetical protein
VFQLVEPLSVSFLFFSLLNKNRYNNKYEGDLSSMMNTHSISSTNTLHKHRLIQHAEGHNKWLKRGLAELLGSAKLPLTQLFLFNGGLCNSNLNSPEFWKFKIKQIKNIQNNIINNKNKTIIIITIKLRIQCFNW